MQTVQNKENSQKDSTVPVSMQSISVVPAKTVPVRGEQPFKMNITETTHLDIGNRLKRPWSVFTPKEIQSPDNPLKVSMKSSTE
ncbi:MAG: hypothetical protein IPP97_10675 [Candidatus Obscuribacter sp.]|nr:hypothetical protein [Candidatus Obscuribacter sp.]